MSAKTLVALPEGHALVALGANLGEREATLEAALELLARDPNCELLKRSSWHKTDPVGGPPGQPRFLNGAALLSTALSPEDLLALLHRIEDRFGRKREVLNGPRTLDLDLLLHGTLKRSGAGLELPHPRLHQRSFVLAPLLELCPDLEVAGRSVRAWHALVTASGTPSPEGVSVPEARAASAS